MIGLRRQLVNNYGLKVEYVSRMMGGQPINRFR